MNKRPGAALRGGLLPRGLRLLLLALVAGVALLRVSSQWLVGGGSPPPCRSPRLVSHRGFDQDERSAPSAASFAALFDSGVSSFDLDLFWPAQGTTGGSQLFVGHPPTLRALWKLPADLPDTPLAELRAAAGGAGALLSLDELLSLLRARSWAAGPQQPAATQPATTLELKYHTRPEWPAMLAALYGAVARSGLADQLGVVVEGRAGAAAHRAAQRAAKTRVPIFGLLRDVGARRDSAGRPHADLSALDADAALYDGWSVSVKLLDSDLVAAGGGHAKPLSVWVADGEAELEAAWRLGVESVITNRPRWASGVMARWRRQCERDADGPWPQQPGPGD